MSRRTGTERRAHPESPPEFPQAVHREHAQPGTKRSLAPPLKLGQFLDHDFQNFLKQIFAFYPRVRITSAFEDDETLDSADKVMAYWERRNREITAKKLLPDRMLHFDLVTVK